MALSEPKNKSHPTVAVVVPVLNECPCLPSLVQQLEDLSADQTVIVDGRSQDGSWQWLQSNLTDHPDWQCLQSKPGRAKQMNLGAKHCLTDIILFLHADTLLPSGAIMILQQQLQERYQQNERVWGFSPLRFMERDYRMRLIAWFINLRSKLTSIATGDQAQFVDRQLFAHIGGFQEIELMEDVALSKALKKISSPMLLDAPVHTSARRWLKAGVLRTVVLMWVLRFAYFIGVAPKRLAKFYRQVR